MIKQWDDWSKKWDQLSKRERYLVMLTVIVAPVALIYIWLLEPAVISLQQTPPQIEKVEREIVDQKRLLKVYREQTIIDPNIKARKELKKLRLALSRHNKQVSDATQSLIAPDRMLELLRSVLNAENGVRLLKAKGLSVEKVELGSAKEGAPKAVIYKHPFELELEGSFQAIYQYLLQVEQLDAVFFWDQLDYEVSEYPTAIIKLRVHTLSFEEGWLGA